MCGIWALLSAKEISSSDLVRYYNACLKIKNRGPEYTSFDCINNKLLIGFHRLAIMDTTIEANQPFHIIRPDGSYFYVICNGEIYNHEIIKTNHQLVTKSNSDCEVIPLLYEKYNNLKKVCEILSDQGSEYAFIIIDVNFDINKNKNNVTLRFARDPLGVRPLFYAINQDNIAISSELKGLSDLYDEISEVKGGEILSYSFSNGLTKEVFFTSTSSGLKYIINKDITKSGAMELIRQNLSEAVIKRLHSDREIAALLSGGLDSSLIVALMRKHLGKSFPVYTIAFKDGSEDLPYAKIVASHLGLEHHIIEIDYEDALSILGEIVEIVETWDITTIRAAVMQYLIGKYIKETSNNRVCMVGEGSDELFQGYLYFHKAPSTEAGHNESIKLLDQIQYFDGRRTDRTMASNGLEVRVPFLDTKLIETVLSFPSQFCRPKGDIEKYILRKAFEKEKISIDGIEKPLLPMEVLYRQKNAFSDAVSKKEHSWHSVITEYMTKHDKYMILANDPRLYRGEPSTNESAYYLSVYRNVFKSRSNLNIIPHYWMPNPEWVNATDPSARTL